MWVQKFGNALLSGAIFYCNFWESHKSSFLGHIFIFIHFLQSTYEGGWFYSDLLLVSWGNFLLDLFFV
jgi:hypothetical protein